MTGPAAQRNVQIDNTKLTSPKIVELTIKLQFDTYRAPSFSRLTDNKILGLVLDYLASFYVNNLDNTEYHVRSG